jgi:hypothetical protein
MEEIISILQDLQNALKDINSDDCEVCYRGLGENNWIDAPTLFRYKNIEKEANMVNEFSRNYPSETRLTHTIDILTELQHYEAPTRLLDATTNALVALFFACGGWDKIANPSRYEILKNKDGAIRIFKVPKDEVKTIDSETVALLANLARLDSDKRKFRDLEWQCERDQMGVWHTGQVESTRLELLHKNVQDVNKVLLVRTNLNTPRIRAQHGVFFIFGGLEGVEGMEYADTETILNQPIKKKEIPFDNSYLYTDVIIPGCYKENILKDLEKYFNISFSTMCPDKQDFIKTITK